MRKEQQRNSTFDFYMKDTIKDSRKLEGMREAIHKAVVQESADNWRSHVPVYGWVQMNYPTTLKPSLVNKYKQFESLKRDETEIENSSIKEKRDSFVKSPLKPRFSTFDAVEKTYFNNKNNVKHKDRLHPEKVNEHVMKEMENLITYDWTQKFMKNYKETDLKFFNEQFNTFEEKTKKKLILDPSVPENYSTLISRFSKTNLYEFGYKYAYAYLTTDKFQNKCDYVDINLFFGKKYCTMYPKRNIIAKEPDQNYTTKIKKIGDISFEEDFPEVENVKNLSRLPPDNITEEWVKSNFTNEVEMLRLENCYWLSKDLLSKIGRLNDRLKELSLRNLEISNFILANILKFANNLEVLDISCCKGFSIGLCDIIAENGNKLKVLRAFSLSKVVNDDGLECLSNISTLTELDIGLCPLISDIGLTKFCKGKVTKLESINLVASLKITNAGLKTLINTFSSTLNKLTISQMYQKGVDSDICSEISKCKKLIFLDISGCVNMSNDSISNIFSSGCELLENINLSNLPINDSTAETAASSNKNLKVLRMSNCKEITNNFLDYLVVVNTSILLLEINKTKKIDDSKIKETLAKKGPNLRIIRATNLTWEMKNNGLKVPLMSIGYEKPSLKGGKTAAKKNDDKNPENQLKKLLEERKPKRPTDYIK